MNKLIIETVFDKFVGVLYDSSQEMITTYVEETELEVVQKAHIQVGCGNFNIERVFFGGDNFEHK